MKLIASVLVFTFCWSFLSMAQTLPSPVPSLAAVAVPAAPAIAADVPVVVASGGIMGWISAHGGIQAVVLLLVGSAMTILSTVRTILYNLDGVAPGAAIPAGMAGLTTVNKICIILGKVVDFLTGNVPH